MEIDQVEPSQRQKDSEDDRMTAAVEAIATQVAIVEEQVARIVGSSQSHKKRRVLKELLQSGGVALQSQQSHPNSMLSSSSHGLNDAAFAAARQVAVAVDPSQQ